jgi:hypothetical protein
VLNMALRACHRERGLVSSEGTVLPETGRVFLQPHTPRNLKHISSASLTNSISLQFLVLEGRLVGAEPRWNARQDPKCPYWITRREEMHARVVTERAIGLNGVLWDVTYGQLLLTLFLGR